MSTAKGRRAGAGASRLTAVPTPRDDGYDERREGRPDHVLVPRVLADDMAAAIAAMQALAAESMLEVAMGLGLAARRQAKPPGPPCPECAVDVLIGYPHLDSCTSEEAVRLRKNAVPKIIG